MSAFFLLLGSWIKKIPWQLWLLTGVVIVAVAWGEFRYQSGQTNIQNKWNASVARGKVLLAQRKEQTKGITVVTETEYVDRIVKVKEKGDTIVKEIPIYITTDVELPGGFRMLHDAAATNTLPRPSDKANAATVSLKAATQTVGENYTSCHVTEERLVSLQDWTYRMCQLYNQKLPRLDQVECTAPY